MLYTNTHRYIDESGLQSLAHDRCASCILRDDAHSIGAEADRDRFPVSSHSQVKTPPKRIDLTA